MFDVWLAVRHAGLTPEQVAACFEPYRPVGWSPGRALANLEEKLADSGFTTDLEPLVDELPTSYSIADAGDVARSVITAAG